MLQPIDTFYPEIADIWVEDIQNIEIAELTCMNLFQHLPYALPNLFTGLRMNRNMCKPVVPDCRPSPDEERRYDGTGLRRIARPGNLCSSFRELSRAQCGVAGDPQVYAA